MYKHICYVSRSPMSPLSLNSGSPTGLIHLKSSLDHSPAFSLLTPLVLAIRPEREWGRPLLEWELDLVLVSHVELVGFPSDSDDLMFSTEKGWSSVGVVYSHMYRYM